MTDKGKVYLVGAGPGDPDLLSVKAMRLLQTATAVVYDRLVSPEIMQCVSPAATQVYVGKTTGHHTLKQDEINALLVRLGRSGQTVIRLKGGDPLVFGRGSEEALALAQARIPFEIVPGISAAQACAAYAGIPLTHRGLARGVQFITGHPREGDEFHLDHAALSDPGQTLVVYMGLANVSRIANELISAGRRADTPAAIIERGTTTRQRTLLTSLEQLPNTVRIHAVESPALLVIGEVVELAEQLSWFTPAVEDGRRRYA